MARVAPTYIGVEATGNLRSGTRRALLQNKGAVQGGGGDGGSVPRGTRRQVAKRASGMPPNCRGRRTAGSAGLPVAIAIKGQAPGVNETLGSA
jgi:hypothetical protein